MLVCCGCGCVVCCVLCVVLVQHNRPEKESWNTDVIETEREKVH